MDLKRRIRKPNFAVAVFALCFSLRAVQAQSSGYDQPYRPQVHFSPSEHWTNDPNGLVFFHGEYHLFFQYNPLGDEWGHMSWGHAVSTDLLHWHQLPLAIPEADGTMIFTGSVVVDHDDTSGLCAPLPECLVAVYTGHLQTPRGNREAQDLAYSTNDGRTWTQYKRNPVLDLHMTDFRDPSVSWSNKDHRWIMAVSLPKEHKVRLYASENLKQWTQLSEFGPAGDIAGDWECPDLLQISGHGNGNEGMWALKVGLNPGAPQGGSGEQYFLGTFDGKVFTPSNEPGAHGWTNYGRDDYCAISFNGIPRGRPPVLIGWMNNWQYAAKLPTSPWRGQMSLPRRLSLVSDDAGLALRQEPVVEPLRLGRGKAVATVLRPTMTTKVIGQVSSPFELDLTFKTDSAPEFGLRIYSDETHWTEIGFDRQKNAFYIDRTRSGINVSPEFPSRTTAPLAPGRPRDIRLVVDRSSIEAYAQNGTVAMTDLIFPSSQQSKIELFSSGGNKTSATGTIWSLASIWQ